MRDSLRNHGRMAGQSRASCRKNSGNAKRRRTDAKPDRQRPLRIMRRGASESRKGEIAARQDEITKQYKEISDKLAEAAQSKNRETVDLGRYAFVKELTREMLEELVKEIRIGKENSIEIVWNFRE